MVDRQPSKSIVTLSSASVDNDSSGDNLQIHPVENVIYIV